MPSSTAPATGQTIRVRESMASKQGQRHRLEECQLTNDAVSAGVGALSTGIGPDREALYPQGKPPLEYLRVGEPGIGHVAMDSACAGVTRSRTRTTANGLVVLVFVVAVDSVVDRAL